MGGENEEGTLASGEYAPRDEGRHIAFASACQSRVDDAYERAIRVEYPEHAPSRGSEQRIRLQIDSPKAILTIGSRGKGVTEGVPVGPGGFGLYTHEHLGVETGRSSYLTVAGDTVWTTRGATCSLTLGDLGVAVGGGLFLGTRDGNVEISAGGVTVNDPLFTVQPSIDPPPVPEVDPASSRLPTEQERTGVGAALALALDHASDLRAIPSNLVTVWRGGRGARGPRAAAIGLALDGLVGVAESVYSAIQAAMAMREGNALHELSDKPETVKIFGKGGVHVTTPETFDVYASDKVSVVGSQSVAFKAARSVSMKTLGAASIFGAVGAKLTAVGPAVVHSSSFVKLQAPSIGISADAGGGVTVASGSLGMDASRSGSVTADELLLRGRRSLLLEGGRVVSVGGAQRLRMDATHAVDITAGPEDDLGQPGAFTFKVMTTNSANINAGEIILEQHGGSAMVHLAENKVELRGREVRFQKMVVDGDTFAFRGNVRLA